jgi:hypothetical protein
MADTVVTEGMFKFINRTRYSSDDICKIYRAWEAIAITHGAPQNEALKADAYRLRDVDTFEIADYNPAAVWTEQSVWNGNTREKKLVANFVRTPGYSLTTRWKIGLVSPHRLYQSPLEALAADSTKAPAEFVSQVADMIAMIYELNGVHWNTREAAREALKAACERGQLTISIGDKRESPAKSDNRDKKNARSRAILSATNMQDDLAAAVQGLTHAVHRFKSLQNDFDTMGETLPLSKDELQAALSGAQSLHQRVERIRQGIRL